MELVLLGDPIDDYLFTALRAFAGAFPHDLARYLIGAGGVYLVINTLLARRLSGRKIRKRSPETKQMRREFLTSLRSTVIFSATGVISVLAAKAGMMDIYVDIGERGWAYFGFNIIVLVILHDAWFYWTHRLIHDPRLFRRFHRTHHQSHNPSPWTSYSFDVEEAFIHALYLTFALLIMPTSVLAIIIFLAHMIFRNAIGHCGYEIFPSWRNGRPVFGWLTTVTHHDLHHAQAGWNYGLYFTWWDRLMETEHPLYDEKFAEAVRKPLDGSATMALGENQSV